jgi:hypothetical protein
LQTGHASKAPPIAVERVTTITDYKRVQLQRLLPGTPNPIRNAENVLLVDCHFLAVETVLYCQETALLAMVSLQSQRLRMVFTVLDGEQENTNENASGIGGDL